jgi:hypothetical protein
VPIRPTLILATLAVAGAGLLAAGGCGPSYKPLPYRPKPLQAPPILVCHDGVGHIKGNKPWILGGTCCCTPTPANFALHQQQGTIDKAMTYEQYLALYKEKGIATDLNHKACGNVCSHGPHVVLGGRCMATPSPGTWMYERVTYGPHTPLTSDEAQRRGAAQVPPSPVPQQF